MPYKDKNIAKIKKREYYLTNKTSLLASSKEIYQKKKENIRKRCKKYYENNKDIINEKRKEKFKLNREKEYRNQQNWNDNNKDKLKKIKKKYKIAHKDEIQKYNKKHRNLLKDYYNNYKKKWRHNNKDKTKNGKLKKYGLTIEKFNNLLQNQNYECGICKKKFKDSYPLQPCVDHDHKTNVVRGLLCHNCNSGIGGLHDNVEYIICALKWIKVVKADISKESLHAPLFSYNKSKKYHLKRDHNITIEQFNNMLFKQEGKCAICSKIFTYEKCSLNPCVDHNHKTGNIRGLLCRKCNISIGLLNDSSFIIQNAINWLKEK